GGEGGRRGAPPGAAKPGCGPPAVARGAAAGGAASGPFLRFGHAGPAPHRCRRFPETSRSRPDRPAPGLTPHRSPKFGQPRRGALAAPRSHAQVRGILMESLGTAVLVFLVSAAFV